MSQQQQQQQQQQDVIEEAPRPTTIVTVTLPQLDEIEQANSPSTEASETTPLVPDREFKPSKAYATKKTIAQGALDVALLMANASQLTALLDVPSHRQDRYFVVLLVLLPMSVVLQIVTGVLLLMMGFSNPTTDACAKRISHINNVSVVLIFFIAAINVFITAFGISFLDENSNNP